ncbi:P-loop NTPase fold protein [Bradyrhizobium sp. CCBAU 53338]|uniref:KAP family P-loop NTPase fold protein n=1 Tax=Bradyrhizobium sp. CCBAU 53338 TaxID=1325111 RepID=UPI00188A1F1E|nr:P-loop NTPase fold protein [Bradyrhizobium sp. CCBAU 53338]QOZ55458.1 hypothetical protein XH90_31880 [Bradyrhizobium sp. CCBAU 53338]
MMDDEIALGNVSLDVCERLKDSNIIRGNGRRTMMKSASVMGRLWKWVRGAEHDAERRGTFSEDLPIGSSREDLLGRGEFARALAGVLSRYRGRESLVVALRGEWGSGKTSIKNLIVETLSARGESPMKVVNFNPWQWGTDEAITRAFFREIAAALGDGGQSLEARARAYEFRRYAKLLEQFSGGIKAAGKQVLDHATWLAGLGLLVAGGVIALEPAAKVLAGLLIGLGVVTLVVSRMLGFIFRDREDARPLDIARARLEKRLQTLPQNILVVVDDIDRLEPEQIRTVIRHIKANASLPGLTYLLLYQRAVIERAFDGGTPGDGRKYLEKVVQTAFDVPVVEGARIGNIVLSELNKLTAALPTDPAFDQTRWGNLWHGGMKHFFRNLRDAKRFIGGVEVQLTLHREPRGLETNLIDTVALEALRLFEPDVYAAVAQSKAFITGTHDRRDTDKEKVKAVVAAASAENKQAVQYIVSKIFPVVDWAFGAPWHGPDWEREWSSRRQICSRQYFDRYFALRVPDGRMSESEFLDFVEHSNDRGYIDRAFADLAKRNLLPEILSRIEQAANAGTLPIARADALVPALFDVAEPLTGDLLGLAERVPFISAWCAVSWYLKGDANLDHRGETFLRALRTSDSLAVPATLISLDIDRREKGDTDLLMTDVQLDAAKAAWVAKLRAALERAPETMIQNPHFVSYLYRWRDFADLSGPREWVASAVTQPNLLPKFLKAFVQTGQAWTLGDYVSHPMVNFQLGNVMSFADLPALVALVRALPQDIEASERAACDQFLKAAEKHLDESASAGEVVGTPPAPDAVCEGTSEEAADPPLPKEDATPD